MSFPWIPVVATDGAHIYCGEFDVVAEGQLARAHHVGHNGRKLLTNKDKYSCSSLLSSRTGGQGRWHRRKHSNSKGFSQRSVACPYRNTSGKSSREDLVDPISRRRTCRPPPPHPVSTPTPPLLSTTTAGFRLGASRRDSR